MPHATGYEIWSPDEDGQLVSKEVTVEEFRDWYRRCTAFYGTVWICDKSVAGSDLVRQGFDPRAIVVKMMFPPGE